MDSEAPVSILLERAAGVMADCARQLGQIEENIAPLLAAPPKGGQLYHALPEAPRPNVIALQDIDLLWQTLEDLAAWLGSLAPEVARNGNVTVDQTPALAGLRLAELRRRLEGGEAPLVAAQSHPVLF